jgi:hypothetical protein
MAKLLQGSGPAGLDSSAGGLGIAKFSQKARGIDPVVPKPITDPHRFGFGI